MFSEDECEVYSPTENTKYYFFATEEKFANFFKRKKYSPKQIFSFFDNLSQLEILRDLIVQVEIDGVSMPIDLVRLSEGEHQALTVLGALALVSEDDSLLLLDEPDTHLNPIWKYGFMAEISQFIENGASTQVIINTHDPLMINGVEKEQVFLFSRSKQGKTVLELPTEDPKGMGIDGLLMSDYYGLASTLDKKSLSLLDRNLELRIKENEQGDLPEQEKNELKESNKSIDSFRIRKTIVTEPLYEEFIDAMENAFKDIYSTIHVSPHEKTRRQEKAREIMKELLANEIH